MARLARSLALLAGFVLLVGSCRTPVDNIHAFLLRTAQPDVIAASDEVTDALHRQLQAGGSLAEGYPVRGHLIVEPDLAGSGVEVMSCAPGPPDEAGEARCILLGDAGDFLRVQPITWQSAAFYRYRIYVAPRSLLSRVDPTKDFVAVDVFALEDATLWEPADQAIRRAVADLGANPFRP